MTANTISATTTRPPTPAANTAPGCSCHRPSATGIDRRASRQPRHNRETVVVRSPAGLRGPVTPPRR
jgi:hypothetical protein